MCWSLTTNRLIFFPSGKRLMTFFFHSHIWPLLNWSQICCLKETLHFHPGDIGILDYWMDFTYLSLLEIRMSDIVDLNHKHHLDTGTTFISDFFSLSSLYNQQILTSRFINALPGRQRVRERLHHYVLSFFQSRTKPVRPQN